MKYSLPEPAVYQLIELLAFIGAIAVLGLAWWYDRRCLLTSLATVCRDLEMANRHISNAQDVLRKNGLKYPGTTGDWRYGKNWESLPTSDAPAPNPPKP
ncbi:MAG: hypothetical protein IAF94_06210 [Pirellulaceae bacterium]|nr:hypothetical protein [Pirellulaceae bacterium]